MQDIVDRNREQGRKLGEQFYKIMEDYKTLLDRGEDFIKKYGITGPDQARDAAIRFCLGNPYVHSVCPSMNTFEELNAFVALSGTRLDPEGEALLADYKAGLGRFYCRHACGRCQGSCSHDVPVNTVMRYYHYFAGQGREKYAMEKYRALPGTDAGMCASCKGGDCEKACPFGVPVQALLVLAHDTMTLKPTDSSG
jgi:predicted aldo/keto reductase-like oxidoreductase